MRVSHGRQPRIPGLDDPPFENHGLFTDRFLTARLDEDHEWHEPEELEQAFQALQTEWEERHRLLNENTNEPQTEENWIKPVLRVLGWDWEVQQPVRGVNRRPDYALLFSAEDKVGLQPYKDTDRIWEHVRVLADAKRWDLPLDRRSDDEPPNIQIAHYLYHSGVRWGILTNGHIWRLYEREKSRGGGAYFQVDLIRLLKADNASDFRWFYCFFSPRAFRRTEQPSFVERVLENSRLYAVDLGDHVRESVYDALRHLMNGFLHHPDNKLAPADPDTIQRVHDLSLIVLYRLLFLLYAEDAGLLPADEEPYRDHSLRKLHQDINRKLRAGTQGYFSRTAGLWESLLSLCRLIDEGFEHNGQRVIPAYNGGLFNPNRFPEIAYAPIDGFRQWRIGDQYLAQAIDTLAYRRPWWDEPGSEDIDYVTLGVRHLGSIYEGLLELRPRVAEEEMIEQPGESGSGGPRIVKAAEVAKPKDVRGPDRRCHEPRRFQPGEVYLVTDRGERKATGSYYTPEYIVNYIVDHTVLPLCEQAAEKTKSLLKDKQRRLRELEAERARTDHPQRRQQLDNEIADLHRSLLEPYLSLKILDPAMGSGHFLVGAADAISLAMATDPSLPAEIVPEDWRDDPQGYYKQLVVEHCLYGVDINPLAVELAKVSLWLHTVQRDKALSFLDHHLRCGNSLIGAWLQEDLMHPPPRRRGNRVVRQEGSQLTLAFWEALSSRHLAWFLDTFRQIVEAPLGDPKIERQKDHWYAEMDRVRDRYRQVANVWLAPYFGVDVEDGHYDRILQALPEPDNSEAWRSLCKERWFLEAFALGGNIQVPGDTPEDDWRRLAAEAISKDENLRSLRRYRFFHWEIEFPEVFFECRNGTPVLCDEERRGFDAVIGNPPHGAALSDCERRLWKVRSSLHDDSAALFTQQAKTLLRSAASFGFVMPKPTAYAQVWAPFRRGLLTGAAGALEQAVDLGRKFSGTSHEQMVIVCSTGPPPMDVTMGELLADARREHKVPTDVCRRFDMLPCNASSAEVTLGLRIARIGVRSDAVVAKRGLAKRFLSAAAGVLALSHEDVLRYEVRPASARVRPDHAGSAMAARLQTRKVVARRLMPRGLHPVPHVVICAAVDVCGLLTLETVANIWPADDAVGEWALCALLNSALLGWYVNRFVYSAPQTSMDFDHYYVSKLPLARFDRTHATSSALLSALLEDAAKVLDVASSRNGAAPVTECAERAILAHAALYGPGGIQELREVEPWRTWIRQADTSFPGREDFVHDLLAMLAKRMTDMHRTKREEIDGFLHWLETMGVPVDQLQGKTTVQKYWRHDFPALLAVLDNPSNRKVLRCDPKERQFRERLEREWETSMNKLRPLLGDIKRTDRLIDRIVYLLYGLTKDEIDLVEGTVGRGDGAGGLPEPAR